MTNYTEAVAEGIAGAGVQEAFGLMGAGTIRLTHLLTARHGVRYHAARHEAGVVGAADGYARVTGRTGLAMTTWGPAVTNTATALTVALRARTPLVYVAADSSHVPPQRNLFAAGTQSIDQRALMEMLRIPVVRPNPRTVRADVARAFEMAQLQRTPVALMLAMEYELAEVWGTAAAPNQQPLEAPLDIEALDSAVSALRESERPIILAGRGAVIAGARDALIALAERTGALLATTMRAKDLFLRVPYNLGVAGGYSTPVPTELFGQADCVLAFGASLNPYTTRHQQLFRQARVIQCDVDTEAMSHYGRPHVAVQGDALAVANKLLDALGADQPRTEFRATADAAGLDAETWRLEIEDISSEGALDPRAICRRLDRLLPEERQVAVDAGGMCEHPPPQMTVPSPEALLWLVGDFGAIGTGLAPAIGAAIGRPDRVTVAIIGDGGFFLTMQELDLAVRDRIPLLVVCLNDRAYGSEYHHIREDGLPEDVPGATFETPDLAALAIAMGCEGERITSLDQLDAATARVAALDRPLFLDCMLTRELVPSRLRNHMRAPGA